MMLKVSSLLTYTPWKTFPCKNSGEIRCLSTRKTRSKSVTSAETRRFPFFKLVFLEMAVLTKLKTFSFWIWSATGGKGKLEILRARRTRLEMTIPELVPSPESQEAGFLTISSSMSILFFADQSFNLVPDLGRFFEILFFNSLPQVILQFFLLLPGFQNIPAGGLRRFPFMDRSTVDFLQKLGYLGTEGDITAPAAETSQLGKVRKSAAADRAFFLLFAGFFLREFLAHAGKQLCQRKYLDFKRIMKSSFVGALLAQVQGDLFIVDDLGQMNFGILFFAVLTEHNF